MDNTRKYIDMGAKVGIAVIALLGLFLLAKVITEFQKMGDDQPYQNSITLTGDGEVISIADIGKFTFSVSETSESVDSAQKMATEKINKALTALKGKGVEEKDIKTLNYNINPKYQWVVDKTNCFSPNNCPNGNSVIVGYDVSQTMEVKIRDTKKAGELLTLVGAQGVGNVSGLQFSIDDEDALKQQAIALAIADAKAKAEKLSKELGIDIDKIVGYSEENYAYPMYDKAMGGGVMTARAEVAATPQTPVGENTITARVFVTFELDN